MGHQNKATITADHQPMIVSCDRKCHKAWGSISRPSIPLSDDPDDVVFLADDELGDAPADPGEYEGGHGKPRSPDHFPNKWCVRACERCVMHRPDEPPKRAHDWSQRLFNMPWLHESEAA